MSNYEYSGDEESFLLKLTPADKENYKSLANPAINDEKECPKPKKVYLISPKQKLRQSLLYFP